MMIIYKYDTETKEFMQELKINEAYGTNLPFATTIKPLAKKEGFAVCFNGTKWEYVEDYRDKTVYSKTTKEELKVDYLGKIKDDVTTLKPEQFDNWDYSSNSWVEDIEAKRTAEINIQIAEAKAYLANTDYKMLPNYVPKADEDLDAIIAKRNETREFIRSNNA